MFWHTDRASDQALRQANDLAEKRALQNKAALANAWGKKGVEDSKVYGGASYGRGGQ